MCLLSRWFKGEGEFLQGDLTLSVCVSVESFIRLKLGKSACIILRFKECSVFFTSQV